MKRKQMVSLVAGASSFLLAGCGPSLIDTQVGSAPKGPAGYLPVENLPPARDDATLTSAEQAKLKQELNAARDAQAVAVKANEGPLPNIAKP